MIAVARHHQKPEPTRSPADAVIGRAQARAELAVDPAAASVASAADREAARQANANEAQELVDGLRGLLDNDTEGTR